MFLLEGQIENLSMFTCICIYKVNDISVLVARAFDSETCLQSRKVQ